MCFCTLASAERSVFGNCCCLRGLPDSRKSFFCGLEMWKRILVLLLLPLLSMRLSSIFLTAIHVNAHSLLRHHDDLISLASAECSHVIAVSETWLDSSVSNSEIHLAVYNLFRFDRNRSCGGGAVYCCDYLPCTLLHCATSSSGFL